MAPLTWRRADVEALPVEGRDDLALVAEDDVEELLQALAEETFEHAEWDEVPSDVATALASGLFWVMQLDAATDDAVADASAAARLGYMARVAEWERLPAARVSNGLMLAGLRDAVEASVAEELGEGGTDQSFYRALGEVTAFFVRREPLDVPYDAEEGLNPMWTVPGMGGDFRALLRDETLLMALEGEDDSPNAPPTESIDDASFEGFQWIWKYGFLLRSFEEFFREE
jgi:hypothetical protein